MWAENGKQPIKPKSQGRGIMVSDFVDEHNGYLNLTDEEFDKEKDSYPKLWKEARCFLKIGAEYKEYWDSEKFLKQVEHSITIAELKYQKETHSLIFLFNQSSGHKAFASDALNVNRMSVNPGRAQPRLLDSIWNGRSQRMVFSSRGHAVKQAAESKVTYE